MKSKIVLFTLLAIIGIPIVLHAQDRLATAYLNNGSILTGQLSKSNNADKYRMAIPNGSIIFFNGNEVKNIAYGQKSNASVQQSSQSGDEATAYLQNGSVIKGKLKKSNTSDSYRMFLSNGSVMYFPGRLVKNIDYQKNRQGSSQNDYSTASHSSINSSIQQVSSGIKGSFGVVAGYNRAMLSNSDAQAYSALHAGVSFLAPVNQNLFGRIDALFSIKGCTNTVLGITTTTSLTFIELPVHIGYEFPVSENIRIFGSAGPYFGYAISGRVKVPELKIDADIYEKGSEVKRLNLGLGARAGVIIIDRLHLYLGYDYGLTKFDDTLDKNLKKVPVQDRTLYTAAAFYF